jgi:hypothetical protein
VSDGLRPDSSIVRPCLLAWSTLLRGRNRKSEEVQRCALTTCSGALTCTRAVPLDSIPGSLMDATWEYAEAVEGNKLSFNAAAADALLPTASPYSAE